MLIRLSLFVLALTVVFCTHVFAQNFEETGEDETKALLTENTLVEELPTSLILDNTRTKIGRDFYENFYREWSEMTADTALAASVMAGLDPEDFIITIDEMPSASSGTIVSITINDQVIWQQFMQPRLDILNAAVSYGAESVRSYFENYQAIQSEFQSQDMSGTGVY